MATVLQSGFGFDQQHSDARIERELHEVLVLGRGPRRLLDEERRIAQILRFHKGKQTALPLKDLALKLGSDGSAVSDRLVKALIRSLIVDFRLPIGSCRGELHGYYLIRTIEEARDTARPLVNEIKKLAQRVRVNVGRHYALEILGQVQLELEKEQEQGS